MRLSFYNSRVIRGWVAITLYCFSGIKVWAAAAPNSNNTVSAAPSLGETANNMLVPVSIFANALYDIFYIIGVSMILGSVIRYREYRDNPSQTRLNQPIFLFLIGLVFILIPFIAQYSPSSAAAGTNP